MYSEQDKHQAIALLKRNKTPEEVASQLDMPVRLVKEWHSKLDTKDLVGLQSNVQAFDDVLNGELIVTGDAEKLLKGKLEAVALDIAIEVDRNVGVNDVMVSKSLQLAADTVCKLYAVIVSKLNESPVGKPNEAGSLFQSIMKD
jgi:hypothetical protein